MPRAGIVSAWCRSPDSPTGVVPKHWAVGSIPIAWLQMSLRPVTGGWTVLTESHRTLPPFPELPLSGGRPSAILRVQKLKAGGVKWLW